MKKTIIFLAVFFGSFSAFLVPYATAPSMVLVLYRMLLTLFLMLPMLWKHRREFLSIPRKTLLLNIGSGVALGLHFTTYFEALRTTSIASCAVLVDTEVLFVALISILFLRKKISPKAMAAILVAFSGAVLVALTDTSSASGALWGDMLALLASIFMAIYTVLGAVCQKDVSTTVYTYLVYAFAAMTVLILSLANGLTLTGYGMENLWAALGMAVFCTLLGHSLFSYCLNFLPATFISTVQLMDCMYAALWGLLFYHQLPGLSILVGGAMIVTGIAVYSRMTTEE